MTRVGETDHVEEFDLPPTQQAENHTPSRVVYEGRFDDPVWGLAPPSESNEGPCGFGVDQAGTAYLVDPANMRVISVDLEGRRTSIAFPEELRSEIVVGFTVAPDGTNFFTLIDGAAATKNGAFIGKADAHDLGWTGAYLTPTASSEGLWVTDGPPGPWRLALTLDGKIPTLATTTASPPGREAASVVDDSFEPDTDTLTLRISDGDRSFTRRLRGPIAGSYVDWRLNDIVASLVVRSENADPYHPSLVLFLDNSNSEPRFINIPIPAENRVANGIYVSVIGDSIYIETGSHDAVQLIQFDLRAISKETRS